MPPPLIDWTVPFLGALREYPSVRHACEVARVNRTTAYRRRGEDKAFADAWDEALEEGREALELELMRRAMRGVAEPVIYKGKVVYRTKLVTLPTGEVVEELERDANGDPVPLQVWKPSETALMFLLKGHMKRRYAERTEVTGADGGPVQVDETTRAARIAALLEAAKRRKDDAEDL